MHPQRLVDHNGIGLSVGIDGPLGRERVVSALPLNKTSGPVLLEAAQVLHDVGLCYLADPDGNLIGTPPIVVHRMLSARFVTDTRRL